MNNLILHLKLQLHQSLLVVVLLLFGACNLVGCGVAGKDPDGLSQVQVIAARTWRENGIPAAASEEWRVCGKIELPSPKYRIQHAANDSSRITLHNLKRSMDVSLSLDTGIVKCKCQQLVVPPSVDTTTHQVNIEVQIADSEDNHFTIVFPLEAPCQVSYCQRKPTTLLTVVQTTISEHLSLELNPTNCNMLKNYWNTIHRVPNLLQLYDDGAVALNLPATKRRGGDKSMAVADGIESAADSKESIPQIHNRHQLGQLCTIDLIRSIKVPNRTDHRNLSDSGEITFVQSLPFDPASCIQWRELYYGRPKQYHAHSSGASAILLSTRPWLSGQYSPSVHHNSRALFTSLQAKPSTVSQFNRIHDEGGKIVGEHAAKRKDSRPREVRQASSSPPVFNDTFYMAYVTENSPLGTLVTGVRATGSGPITYTMTPDNGYSDGLFSMNSSTGVVTTTERIDREMISSHTFRIQALDIAGRSSIAQMTIVVEDENDNVPTFEHSYFNITVDEDTERTSTVLRFSVNDNDLGQNGIVDFVLVNNTDNTFTVADSGSQVAIILNQQLDFESQRFYLLTITARDRGSPPQSSSATLEIHVIDVADSIPQFNATSYSVELPEDTSPPAYLLTVHATSQDSGSLAAVQYIKVSGDSNNQFSVNGITGAITLTKSLDFETTQVHVIVVQAQSVADSTLHSQANVHITVTNVNDHYPVFTRQVYSISVLETVSPGHLVISVDASDLDEGIFGDVFYRFSVFSEQAIYDTFRLDLQSGQITTVSSLDREQREQYTFTVIARDSGTPALSSTSRVSITVSDVNDEPPIFSQRQYNATISENLDAGRSVVQVSAEDSDSATSFVYYIQSGNINNAFGINHDGLITTRIRLDREEYASYSLIVVASDSSNENTTNVFISVLDLNDESPSFELSLYNLPPISEGLSVGSEVGRVQALDPDDGSNGEVTYTSTNIDPKFTIDRTTGAILLSSTLDYEDTDRYVFDVIATDGGQPLLSSTARVQISVLDENDNSPVFEPHPSTLSIFENRPAGEIITTVTATDADSGSNAAVQYEISGDNQARRAFGIRQNGDIFTQQSLDREVIGQYHLIVAASDSGAVRQTATMTVTVNINDIIDYPPVFSQVVYEVLITSALSRGLPVVTVHARTLDLVQPRSIIYHITSGANSTLFRMDQTTGMIFAETRIDPVLHEGVYRLGVMAQHRHLSESVFVIIRVMLDDGIPRLRPLTLYFSAYPTLIEQVNHLGVVEIQQPKEGQEYAFSLVYSDPRLQRHFSINPTTGYLSVTDGVVSGSYQLNVSASTSTGIGFVIIDVFVSILTNQTLENVVVAKFGGAREASFASIQLNQFIQSLMEVVPCSRSQVEIVGIQRSGPQRDEMVEVAFAILQPDLTSYPPRERIIDVLQANWHNLQPSTLLSILSDVCSEEPCSNLQQCHPIVEIHKHNVASPFQVISGTHHFHTFRHSFVCSCPQGYSLDDLCSSEINECDPSPCYFGAECTNLIGDYQCACPPGTYDKNCSSLCTSRQSCDPCSPNPCLYGGGCVRRPQDFTSYTCEDCPWRTEYSGHNCELTSLHFTTERLSFVAFQTNYGASRFNLNFRFTTISPNGLLFYSGHLENQQDYIATELVIGQLRVGVSFGSEATTLTTNSIWNLNDGLWHSVNIKLENRVLMVEVSDCSEQTQFLQGAVETCQLETELLPETGRILELTSLVYFGGLEAHVHHNNILSTTYDGCIADVELGGRLLDFGQPEREEGTKIGCPPLEALCSQICPRNQECVQLWGGTVCNCEGDGCVGGSSVELSTGYIHLQSSSTITLMSFILYFRTRSSDAVLVQFGAFDSLELKHGSIVYRRGYSSSNMYTPLTLEVVGAVSDGVWHKVRLDINSTHTKLSVDQGRSSASIPEGGIMRITTVTLGAETPNSNSSRFSGCLAGMVINSESINLESALMEALLNQHFQVSTHMAGSGCGQGNPCNGVQCPDNTVCEAGWQNYSCVCNMPNRVINNQCVSPCSTEPCKNGGTCEVIPVGSAGFQCTCPEGYPLPTCEDEDDSTCHVGFYDPPNCNEQCLCDPRGAEAQICDSNTGACICKAELDVYSLSGGLGCQPCDCHAVGSSSSECNGDTGQCLCRENVMGRRCDQCIENFAGMNELGCKAATVVYGRFTFLNLFYEEQIGVSNSPRFKELSQRIATEVERELYSFALPGRFEVTIQNLFNSSGRVMVRYKVSSYLPRGSVNVPRPSYALLAGVMQSMVQSGWVGPLQTNSSSHNVPIVCSQVPELCNGCPNATTRDGIICRASLSCPGEDLDRDGVSDPCDNCPHSFNPDQNSTHCELMEGACPGGVASDIVWSQTAIGMVDIKRCPLPLIGFASRTCRAGQQWGEVDLIGCISVTGQEFLAQAESLESGQSLSFSQLNEAATDLEEFTNEQELTVDQLMGGDIQVAGRVLDGLLRQLNGYSDSSSETPGQDEISTLFAKLVSITDNLLSPNPSQGWVDVVEEAGFGAENFLTTLEQLPVLTLSNMWENSLESSSQEHLTIKTRQPSTAAGNQLNISNTLSLTELSASLELSLATPTSSVAMALFSNLGPALNSYLFQSDARDPLTVATPILSVQMFNNELSKVTTLTTPINLTLPYKGRLFLSEARFNARCVWWQPGERSGWSTEGCETVSTMSLTHLTCRCTHLTAFAAVLPESAFVEVLIPPERFIPTHFTYVVFSIVAILFVVTLLLLACLRHMQNLLNTTHKNLLLALFLTTVIFVIGINRTEVGGVCGAFGIAMFYTYLACISWMVANGIMIARFLLNSPPKQKFAITLYIVGWALPALLSGIAIGTVAIIQRSGGFLYEFGYPHYCWISMQSFSGLVASSLLLILLYAVAVIASIGIRFKIKKAGDRGRNVSTAAAVIRNNTSVVLLKSCSIVVLFLVTWALGLIAIYLRDESYGVYLQYPFAIFYAIFGITVSIILCVNKQFKESWKVQFEKQPDVIIGQAPGPVYAEIRKPPTTKRRSGGQHHHQHQQQQRRQQHHRGYRNPPNSNNPPHSVTPAVQTERVARPFNMGEMVELMSIVPPPTHPPPSPRAINEQMSSLAQHAQSSPLLRNNIIGGGTAHQNQNRFTSERHIAENQLQSSLLHIPEMRPFSPLTYGSDSGSHDSNLDVGHHDSPLLRRAMEETDGATGAPTTTKTTTLGVREKEDLSNTTPATIVQTCSHEDEIVKLTSPTLTEIYEQARQNSHSNRTSAKSSDAGQRPGSHQDSELGDIHPISSMAREGNGLAGMNEDPLWYKNRESVKGESEPMPYETVVRSPPLLTNTSVPVSPLPVDEGEKKGLSSVFPMMSLTSPYHSDCSVASSSKRSSISRSSSHNRSPTSVSPPNIKSLRHEHERKRSLPVELAKRHGSATGTTNPLYSTSSTLSSKKRSRKKHHGSFNSPKEGKPLPPLPSPAGPIHTSPLPPLPYPLEAPGPGGDVARMKKRSVVRTGSDTAKHTHFAPQVPAHHHHHHHQLSDTAVSGREFPSKSAAVVPPTTLPLPQITTPPISQVSNTKRTSSTSPSSLQPHVQEERKSASCSNSPAQPRQKKKKRGLERNDSYHSEGPSAEGRNVNQVFRHTDGSKTVQSLV